MEALRQENSTLSRLVASMRAVSGKAANLACNAAGHAHTHPPRARALQALATTLGPAHPVLAWRPPAREPLPDVDEVDSGRPQQGAKAGAAPQPPAPAPAPAQADATAALMALADVAGRQKEGGEQGASPAKRPRTDSTPEVLPPTTSGWMQGGTPALWGHALHQHPPTGQQVAPALPSPAATSRIPASPAVGAHAGHSAAPRFVLTASASQGRSSTAPSQSSGPAMPSIPHGTFSAPVGSGHGKGFSGGSAGYSAMQLGAPPPDELGKHKGGQMRAPGHGTHLLQSQGAVRYTLADLAAAGEALATHEALKRHRV